MIRRALMSVGRLKPLTYASRATIFGQRNFDTSKDYYLTLGVSKNSTDSDIKKAYYNLAKMYHPDHTKGQDAKFKEINEAYEVLSDAGRRREYDASRTFGDFSQGFKSKAREGSYNYQDYQNVYSRMSPLEQEQVRQRLNALMRRMFLYSLGIMLFWMLFTRRPNQVYEEMNGNLVPISPQQIYSMAQPAYSGPGAAYGSPYPAYPQQVGQYQYQVPQQTPQQNYAYYPQANYQQPR